jgi:hypothetical protein
MLTAGLCYVLFGCKSPSQPDDLIDENQPNQIVYLGKSHPLASCRIYLEGQNSSGLSNYYFSFIGPNIIRDTSGSYIGTDDVFWFEDLYCSGTNIEGAYTLYPRETPVSITAGVLREASMSADETFPNPSYEPLIDCVQGALTIEKRTDGYLFSFNGLDTAGNTLTMFYKGPCFQ